MTRIRAATAAMAAVMLTAGCGGDLEQPGGLTGLEPPADPEYETGPIDPGLEPAPVEPQPVGSTFEVVGEDGVGTAAITLLDAEFVTSLDPLLSPEDLEYGGPSAPDRGFYLVLSIEVRNTGATSWVDPGQLLIQGPDGEVYSAGDAGLSIADELNGLPQISSIVRLQPGQKETGFDLWDLPFGSGGLLLNEDLGFSPGGPQRLAAWTLP